MRKRIRNVARIRRVACRTFARSYRRSFIDRFGRLFKRFFRRFGGGFLRLLRLFFRFREGNRFGGFCRDSGNTFVLYGLDDRRRLFRRAFYDANIRHRRIGNNRRRRRRGTPYAPKRQAKQHGDKSGRTQSGANPAAHAQSRCG